MANIESTIKQLKHEANSLSVQNEDAAQYMPDTYYLDFENETLSDDEIEDFFAGNGYVISVNDIISFLESLTCEWLLEKQNSTFDNLEMLKSDNHNAVKSMERDITDLRRYKKKIKEISSICEDRIALIDSLIEAIDRHRK